MSDYFILCFSEHATQAQWTPEAWKAAGEGVEKTFKVFGETPFDCRVGPAKYILYS